ncbi:hypothetical protein EDC04DRAFT_395438 [Pisolithus marmoratus]|nr:hypothetical protein EDC04DRAFT_395438 [Pisolithus marmoratus]
MFWNSHCRISWFVSVLSVSTCLLWSPCYINQVPSIQQSFYHLRMPTLSNSKKYSLQYTAEQSIGAILILEYFYFLLQVKDQRNDLQVINEAFQEHGDNVENLFPILFQVAKEKQMSRNMNRMG